MGALLSQLEIFNDADADVDVDAGRDAAAAADFAALRGVVVEVEGNIGSGKSTLTKHIKTCASSVVGDADADDDDHVTVFAEFNNPSFLAAFYGDMTRFSFAFQTFMLASRRYQLDEGHRQAVEPRERRTVFLDRGAVGDTLFAMVGVQNGVMQPDEFAIYTSVCQESLPATLADKVDVLLFLDVDYRECHRRITTLRRDSAEDGIPLAYLEQLDTTYFDLMVHWMGRASSALAATALSSSSSSSSRPFCDMNVGRAPPVLVLRWDAYGDTRAVVHELANLVRGTRRSPTIRFITTTTAAAAAAADTAAATVWLESNDAVERLFQRTRGAVAIPPSTRVSISWTLPHTNAFRRVVYYCLAQCCDVAFVVPPSPATTPTPTIDT